MPEYVLQLLVEILTPVLLALSAWVASELSRWLRTRIRNEQVQAATDRALHVTEVAVAEVAQTFVSSLKEHALDGKLSKEEAQIAVSQAVAIAKTHLGERGVQEVKQVLGFNSDNDLVKYLVSLIEAQISSVKK